jgi:hypothetical protein
LITAANGPVAPDGQPAPAVTGMVVAMSVTGPVRASTLALPE